MMLFAEAKVIIRHYRKDEDYFKKNNGPIFTNKSMVFVSCTVQIILNSQDIITVQYSCNEYIKMYKKLINFQNTSPGKLVIN